MGGTPNVMGMVNDSDFQALAPSDKRSALLKLTGDKSFSSLSDAETMQFVSRMARPTEAQQVKTGLPQPQQPIPQALQAPAPTDKVMIQSGAAGIPIGMDVPKGYGQAVQDANRKAVIGATAIGPVAAGAIANPVGTAVGTVSALGGARVGGSGGQYIGNLVGEPQIGKSVGTVIGSLAGGIGGPGALEYLSSKGYLKLLLSSEVNQAAKLAVAKQALAEKPELAESPQDLINRMKKLVIPGEQPTGADLKRAGDLTQTPLTKLQALAKFGDRLAQNELNRRLKQ